MNSSVSTGSTDDRYYRTSFTKFILLDACTFGLYEVYWNYRNWKYIKQRDQSDLRPFWRAIFFPLWFYALLNDISKVTGKKFFHSMVYKWALVIAIVAFALAARLPDPFWLITLLGFLPFLPVISVIERLNIAEGVTASKATSHRPVHYAIYLLGTSLLALIVLSSINFFPSTAVIPGNALWERDVVFLREHNILAPDEQIEYFYSMALFSNKADGQFISADYVTSYWKDPDDQELYMAYAAYEEITDVRVSWGNSLLEDTIVTIVTDDGGEFELWLSTERSGDKRFVSVLKHTWEAKRTKF